MEKIALKFGANELVLHGSGRLPVLRGCLRQPAQRLPDGSVQEKLDLVLQGSTAQTRAFISLLQTIIARVPLQPPVDLIIHSGSPALAYSSRVLAASFNWIVGSNQARGIGIRLEVRRPDYWTLPWQPLPLRNVYGSGATSPLRVDNRADSQGVNACWVDGADLTGDLPAPLRLSIHHDLKPGVSIDSIRLGMGRCRRSPLAVLEGEAASSMLSFGVVTQPACHGGAYGLVQWEYSGALRILTWVLPGAAFTALAGARLKPLMRLVNPAAIREGTWLSWKLYHGSLVYQSAACPLARDRELQEMPPICLPSLPASPHTWNDMSLELFAHNRAGGICQLALDAVFLFFSDGWRQFNALPQGRLAYGETLIDTADEEMPYCHLSQPDKIQHAFRVSGAGIWLLPGEDHVLNILLDTGVAMPLDLSVHMAAQVQPRARLLP